MLLDDCINEGKASLHCEAQTYTIFLPVVNVRLVFIKFSVELGVHPLMEISCRVCYATDSGLTVAISLVS